MTRTKLHFWLSFVLAGCAGAGQTAEDARKDAACAATRTLFDEAQTRVLKASCLDYPSADTCPAHIALREAFVESLERLECETPQ